MKNDETGETAAISVIAGVYFNAKTKKASPIPEDVRERALAAINGQEIGTGAQVTVPVKNLTATNSLRV